MNKLVRIPGIVISASVLSSRATKLHLQCRACRSPKTIYPPGGLGGVGGGSDRGLPRVCDAPKPDGQDKDCPIDPYLINHSKSTFADQQTLKLQEAPDMVPVGELPRHMLLSTDRYLTGRVVPGSRIIATGVYSTFQSAKNVGFRPYSFLEKMMESTRRKTRDPPLFDNLTFESFILKFRGRQRLAPAQTRLDSNSVQKKRRSLARWPEARVSTNGLRRVSLPVYSEALVCAGRPLSRTPSHFSI